MHGLTYLQYLGYFLSGFHDDIKIRIRSHESIDLNRTAKSNWRINFFTMRKSIVDLREIIAIGRSLGEMVRSWTFWIWATCKSKPYFLFQTFEPFVAATI